MEVVIEEARASDAIGIKQLFIVLEEETTYITETENVTQTSLSALEKYLDLQNNSESDLCLLIKINQEIVGILNVTNSHHETSQHIGELFMAIKKTFRGYGLGRDLLEMAIDWANQTPVLRKLELQVQVRNEIAQSLYEKCGFRIEGTRKKGVKTKDGEFLDLYYMGKVLK
ncbi:GNAT family N-acetyltransferase [Streptococcus uberis]|uniref:GNAT family N-acetyltransferase n=1 Tax=Streptococcus uberis TaxID=1349 RepID=UPI0006202627|nr:GNAT family protein [Streptococcus uberis]